jgi:hypothetical protein
MHDPLQAEERKTVICYISLCLLECVNDGCLIPWRKFSRIRSLLSAGSEAHCDMHKSSTYPYQAMPLLSVEVRVHLPYQAISCAVLVDKSALGDVLLSTVCQCFIP